MLTALYNAARNLISKPAPRAVADQPRSSKHVRVTHWTFDVAVAYYDHGGRKLTARRYSYSQYAAVLASARAKGYRVIGG